MLAAPCSLAAREKSPELYRQGASYALAGDIDRAIEVFKKVVERSPYYCMGHYGLGKAYLYKYGMLDQAVRHLRESVKLDRKLARGHFYLGMAYMLQVQYVRSLHAFKAAYETDDTLVEALYNMAAIYEIIGKDYEAWFYFRKYYEEKERGGDSLF
jgi:tetratricopeptide (TPR) repeat protein